MTYEEYEIELTKLDKAKKGYDGNRTLCAAVLVILGYSTFKDNGHLSSPWYILLILGLIACATVGILIHDSLVIRDLNKKIKDLEEHKPEMTDSSSKDSE